MKTLSKWLKIYLLSGLLCFIFWLGTHLKSATGASQSSMMFDYYNVINAGLFFPISAFWLKTIGEHAGHQSSSVAAIDGVLMEPATFWRFRQVTPQSSFLVALIQSFSNGWARLSLP